MQFSYSNRPATTPTLYLNGTALERVTEFRYLGLIIQENPSVWTSHCSMVLNRARKVFYAFRTYYAKDAPNSVMMTVYRAAVRSVLDYCCDLYFPNSYYCSRIERVQKLALRMYLHDFDVSYDRALWNCSVERLSSRRAASAVVNLLKYVLHAHFILPGFCVLQHQLHLRRSLRSDTGRDLVLVRNYPGDNSLHQFSTISPSFKKSFFFRATSNYNTLRRIIDLDQYCFSDLRRILSLFFYDNVTGLVSL